MRIDQITARAALLEERIASGRTHQKQFLEEHDWSPARWFSDWSAGVKPPDVRLWQEAADIMASMTCGDDEESLLDAEEILKQAERAETRARTIWERYRNATIRGGEMLSDLEQEFEHGTIVATATGLGIAVAVPAAIIAGGVLATAGLGTAAVIGGSALVGALVGGAVGGTSGAAGSTIVEGVRSLKTGAGYEFDDAAFDQAAADSALYGAIGGVTAGGVAMTEATVGLKTLAVQLWEGASGQAIAMAERAATNITSPAFWRTTGTISTVGAGIRAYYDVADMTVVGNEKTSGEVAENIGKVFVFGGLGSVVFAGPVAYHYVALDLLSDTSQRYLTDIRERYGDEEGYAISGGVFAAENGAALLVFHRMLGRWGPAAITTAGASVVSIIVETRSQLRSGKNWATLDPGRFVGSAVWGHTAVILPKEILARAVAATTIANAAARTMQLGAEYVLIVPSLANLQARMNRQNYKYVLQGELVRQTTLMGGARLVQALFDPTGLGTIVVDEGCGIITTGIMDDWFPPYQGIPVWSDDLLAKVRALGTAVSYDELTRYFSEELGERFLKYGGAYVPSSVNLELAEIILKEEGRETERRLFHQYYLAPLAHKGEARTVQEDIIFRQFADEAPPTFASSSSATFLDLPDILR